MKSKEIQISDRDSQAFSGLELDMKSLDIAYQMAQHLHIQNIRNIEKSNHELWVHIRSAYSLKEGLQYRAVYSQKDSTFIIKEMAKEGGQ